jgi:VIT1/CCC1 family predicted Fe2+/Mn2+ transporter
MLKALYIIAIGLLFSAFVGFGVATFYKAPTPPESATVTRPITEEKTDETIDQKATDEYAQYQEDIDAYNRNLSIIYLVSSMIIIAVSIFGLGKIDIIGDGITLGGIFLLFTGIVTSFGSGEEIFRFIAVTIGLIAVLFLSWWKFIRQQAKIEA